MEKITKQVHNSDGPCHVAIDKHMLLSGGNNGTVALHPLKRWPNCKAICEFPAAHNGSVTALALNLKHNLAFSGGLDSQILMYRDLDKTKVQKVPFLRLTGQIRALQLNQTGNKLFIVSDTVRIVNLEGKLEVLCLSVNVPHPILSVALSPCEKFIACASASGHVGLLPLKDSGTTGNETQIEEEPMTNTQSLLFGTQMIGGPELRGVVLKDVLTNSRRKDDRHPLKLGWFPLPSGDNQSNYKPMLAIPERNGMRIVVIDRQAIGGFRPLGTVAVPPAFLHEEKKEEPTAVQIFANLKTKNPTFSMLFSTDQDRFAILKVSQKPKGWSAKVEKTFHIPCNDDTENVKRLFLPGAVSSWSVSNLSGSLAIGIADGKVRIQKNYVPCVVSKNAKNIESGSEQTQTMKEESQMEKPANIAVSPSEDRKEESSVKGSSDDEESSSEESSTASDSESENDAVLLGKDKKKKAVSDELLPEEAFDPNDDENYHETVEDLKRTNPDYIHESGKKRDHALRRHAEKKVHKAKNKVHEDSNEESDAESLVGKSKYIDDTVESTSADEESEVDAEEGFEEFATEHEMRRRHQHSEEFEDNGSQQFGISTQSLQKLLGPTRQGPIQIGQTHPDPEGRRFLAFNCHGAIKSEPSRSGQPGSDPSTQPQSLTVMFHDTAQGVARIHRSTGFCLMAALGPHGASFVFESAIGALQTEDTAQRMEGRKYELYHRNFVGIGLHTEWDIALPSHEMPQSIAEGKRFVALFTTCYLRVFSPCGLEFAIVSCDDAIVCSSGLNNTLCPYYNKVDNVDPLMICYYPNAASYPATPQSELMIKVLNIEENGKIMLPPTPIALTHQYDQNLTSVQSSQLAWAGWSDDGHIYVADTTGVVRMLTVDYGRSWLPVYDPRGLVEYTKIWLWGIGADALWTYLLTGNDVAPPVGTELAPPQKITMSVPVLRPAVGIGGEKSVLLRQIHMRFEAKLNEVKHNAEVYTPAIAHQDYQLDQALLQQFELEIAADRLGKAFDIVTRFQLVQTVERAMQYAARTNHASLAEKITKIGTLRLKAKRKRLCTLPQEREMDSDADRDKAIRNLVKRCRELETQQKELEQLLRSGKATVVAVGQPSEEGKGPRPPTPSPVREDKAEELPPLPPPPPKQKIPEPLPVSRPTGPQFSKPVADESPATKTHKKEESKSGAPGNPFKTGSIHRSGVLSASKVLPQPPRITPPPSPARPSRPLLGNTPGTDTPKIVLPDSTPAPPAEQTNVSRRVTFGPTKEYQPIPEAAVSAPVGDVTPPAATTAAISPAKSGFQKKLKNQDPFANTKDQLVEDLSTPWRDLDPTMTQEPCTKLSHGAVGDAINVDEGALCKPTLSPEFGIPTTTSVEVAAVLKKREREEDEEEETNEYSILSSIPFLSSKQ